MDILNPENEAIFVGGGGLDYKAPQMLSLKLANRHGLIAGATGTGKTVTLQTLAESFSAAGTPVFMADVKGDLSGIAAPGRREAPLHEAFTERANTIGFDLDYRGFPVTFWDIFGQDGHPIRTTPAEMGPLLLSRLLNLTDAQEGVMNIAFRIADEEGLPLADLKDLQAIVRHIGEDAKELTLQYGNVSRASVGAIQRRLLVLENEGGGSFFGEPALDLGDLIRHDEAGRGMINVLAADKLMLSPRLYATFLLWLISELFEQLPEVGDPDRPVMAFFFDEAHLLFDDAPDALIEKVEQVARLIRSKGVSLWFVTQSPSDVPEKILGQLGNRVQHALRGFTAKDQRALRDAADNYRPNPTFDTAEAIQNVGTGEAVTSFLEKKGAPGVVERTLIRPPLTQLGPLDPALRADIMAQSAMAGRYDDALDRDSAHEMLARRAEASAREAEQSDLFEVRDEDGFKAARRYRAGQRDDMKPSKSAKSRASGSRRTDSIATTFGKSFARQFGTQAGRAVVRGVLGSMFRGR